MVNGQIKKNELLLRKAVVGEVCGVWIMFGVIKKSQCFRNKQWWSDWCLALGSREVLGSSVSDWNMQAGGLKLLL